MILDEKNLGVELRILFQKFYVLDDFKLNFDDFKIYKEALENFQFDYNRCKSSAKSRHYLLKS